MLYRLSIAEKLGWFIPGNEIKVDKVHLYREGVWEQTSVEELSSEAFSLNQGRLAPLDRIAAVDFEFSASGDCLPSLVFVLFLRFLHLY